MYIIFYNKLKSLKYQLKQGKIIVKYCKKILALNLYIIYSFFRKLIKNRIVIVYEFNWNDELYIYFY